MDWFKGKFTGKPHIQWENPWFPVKIFPTKPIHSQIPSDSCRPNAQCLGIILIKGQQRDCRHGHTAAVEARPEWSLKG
jgi:hypothetical protein